MAEFERDGSVRDMDVSAWQARATAWELLAISLRYPEHELACAVASGEWAQAADEIAAALGASAPGFGALAGDAPTAASEAAVSGNASGEAVADALLHALRAEATRLFVGAPEPEVSPYEGVWGAKDDDVQPLLFVSPRAMAVERFCRDCGLGRPEGTNEPLDHVATECELLEHLASVTAGFAALPEGFVGESLPGGSAQAAYALFFEEHAATWMPRFADAVAAAARYPFFRDAAALLRVVVDAESERFAVAG